MDGGLNRSGITKKTTDLAEPPERHPMNQVRRFGLALAIGLAGTLAANAADWTNWPAPGARRCPPETGLAATWSPDGENLVWKAPIGSRSTPHGKKGRVFVLKYAIEKEQNETIQE